MNAEAFFAKIRTYADLSAEAELAWSSLHREGHFAIANLSFPLAFSDVRSSP